MMRTYLVNGFHRSNYDSHVSILVDVEYPEAVAAGDQFEVASQIAGDDDICFHASSNVTEAVPDDAKGIIFNSVAELYAKAPQLDPALKRKQRRAIKRQQRAGGQRHA